MKCTAITLTVLLLALAPSLTAQETYSGETRDAIDGRGLTSLQVDLGNGFTVILRGTDTDSISYHYDFEGNRLAHERNFNRAEFLLERQGDAARLSIRFPELKQMRRNADQSWLRRLFGSDVRNFNIEKQELRVEMPRDLALRLGTRYSNVDISDVGRELQVATRSGTVSVNDVGGDLTVNNEYGNTSVRQVRGSVQIGSRSSDVTVRGVQGETRINSPYSNIEAHDISGRTNIQTQSGSLDAGQIRGPLVVQADYTEMSINGIEGGVTVRSRSGDLAISDVPVLAFAGEYTDVRARNLTRAETNTIQNRSANVAMTNVEGETRISGEYLEVSLEDIRGELSVENRSGSVKASRVMGVASITGEYLEIDLNRFAGAMLGIRNRSGDVNVESTGNALSDVDILVSHGDVQFSLGREYQGRYAFATRYGSLNLGDSPFGTELESEQPPNRDQTVTGTLGTNRNNTFRIETRNGDITVTVRD